MKRFINKVDVESISRSLTIQLEEEKNYIYLTIFKLLKKDGLNNIINKINKRIYYGEDTHQAFINVLENDKTIPIEISSFKQILYEIENKNWIELFS